MEFADQEFLSHAVIIVRCEEKLYLNSFLLTITYANQVLSATYLQIFKMCVNTACPFLTTILPVLSPGTGQGLLDS